jgi:branched-chain amino acid transport system substrate-binding protein
VVADMAMPPGASSAEFARQELARLVALRPDAVFLAATGREAAQLIRDLRRLAPGLPLVGRPGLLEPEVVQAAGEAAIGVRALEVLTPDAPGAALAAFRDGYQARYHGAPDSLVMQGYIALSMLRAAVERTTEALPGGVIQTAANHPPANPPGAMLAEALRAAPLRAETTPGILLDTAWNAAGEPQRDAYMAELLPGGKLGWTRLSA